MKDNSTKQHNRVFLKLLARLKANFKYQTSSFKSRILVYLAFVLLAFVLWFYRALDDTFVANISYPVQYQNLPKNKILLSTPPEKVALRVRGNGYTILSNKLKFKRPLDFNVNSFLLYSQDYDSMSVYILSRYAREELSQDLNSKNTDLEIISIEPDSIFFTFARTKAKKVAIRPNIANTEMLLAEQHILNGTITSKPDSIDIIGPSAIIDTIQYIYTQELTPTALNDTFSKKIALAPIEQINFPIKKVNISIPVDRFTEFGYQIPIKTRNVPDSINMKLFPRSVKISFNIAHSNINKVSKNDFLPYIDYNEIGARTGQQSNRLSIKLDSTPKYVHAVRIYPSGAEYINELNNASSRNNRGNR